MGKLVFFVDDDKMILNLLEYTLKNRQDYEVKTFFTGEECLAQLGLKPDLIVLDHHFKSNGNSSKNGLEVLKEIKHRDSKLPVIILTSNEDQDLAEEFISSGASRYIPKNDYFIDALMESIEQQIL
ncbi:MAG: response regulator [Bacteroidales bacterium]|nr:response regulator [Bacteroidales bacterium]